MYYLRKIDTGTTPAYWSGQLCRWTTSFAFAFLAESPDFAQKFGETAIPPEDGWEVCERGTGAVMLGARVEGRTSVMVTAAGGNDGARQLCAELVQLIEGKMTISDLLAQRERMRQALVKIADWQGSWGPFPENNEDWCAMAVLTARETVNADGVVL